MSIDHLGEIRIIKQTVDTLVMTIAGLHYNGEHTIIIKKDEFIGLDMFEDKIHFFFKNFPSIRAKCPTDKKVLDSLTKFVKNFVNEIDL